MIRREVVRSLFLNLALTVILFLTGILVPFLGMILVPLAMQPVLGFGVKFGKGYGIALAFLAVLVLYNFGGRELGLGYFLLAQMAVFLFYSFHRAGSIETMVIGAAGGMVAGSLLILTLLAGSFQALGQVIREALEENLELSLKFYEKAGLSSETLEMIRENAPRVIETVLQILPALAFASFATAIVINIVLLCRRFPQVRGAEIPEFDLKEWKSPEAMVWFFIGSGFFLILPEAVGLKVLALNLLLSMGVCYLFQGLSIVAFYFHRKKVPIFLRGLGYLLILFEQILTLVVAGLGLFDLWGDFRRLDKKENPSQAG